MCPLQRRDWCIDLLARHEATDVLDLTVPSTGSYRQWLSEHPIVPLLTRFPLVPSQPSIPLKVGRFYLTDSEFSISEFRGVENSTQQLFYRKWQMSERSRRHRLPSVDSNLIPIEPSSEWASFPSSSVPHLMANIHVEGISTIDGRISQYKIRKIVYDKFHVPFHLSDSVPTLATPPVSSIEIFTDGAWNQILDDRQSLFGLHPGEHPRRYLSSGGVILHKRQLQSLYIVDGLDHDTIQVSSSYEPPWIIY